MPRQTDVGVGAAVRTLIPARIDRLPWSSFHTRMVVALGVAWILDGLEITIASAVAGVLSTPEALNLSSTAVGTVATVYLAGEVAGALIFGRLSDAMGRRRLFMVTLAIYMFRSGLTALTAGSSVGWVVLLYATRFVAGTRPVRLSTSSIRPVGTCSARTPRPRRCHTGGSDTCTGAHAMASSDTEAPVETLILVDSTFYRSFATSSSRHAAPPNGSATPSHPPAATL
jgi:hypothetical protein